MTQRNLRAFLTWNVVAIGLTLLGLWTGRAFAARGALEPMSASQVVGTGVGVGLVLFALLGLSLVAVAHRRPSLLLDHSADDIREQARAQIYSWIAIAAMGGTLVLLSFASPGAALSPAVALVGALVLLALAAGLSVAIWPLLDEFSRALSNETGNLAFYLIVVLGGGWAMLAHLGFVAAPAPLDWLTMFTLLMFVASFIAAGRRGLLKR